MGSRLHKLREAQDLLYSHVQLQPAIIPIPATVSLTYTSTWWALCPPRMVSCTCSQWWTIRHAGLRLFPSPIPPPSPVLRPSFTGESPAAAIMSFDQLCLLLLCELQCANFSLADFCLLPPVQWTRRPHQSAVHEHFLGLDCWVDWYFHLSWVMLGLGVTSKETNS